MVIIVNNITVTYVELTRYIQVASMALIVYDHFLTFQEEVDFVWRDAHRRSWARFLFLTARYAPIAAILANTSALLQIRHTKHVSKNWLLFHGWSGFAFFAAVQVISQLRLWAIYRSKIVLGFMTIVILLGLATMGTIEGLGYRSLKVTNAPVKGLFHICGPTFLPHFVYAFWIPPLVIESISVILVIHKAVQHIRLGQPKDWVGTRFMSSIVRYSVIYFVVVLLVYTANLYIWANLDIPAFELFVPLTFALPSVTGNRMLLSLRSIYYTDNHLKPGQDNIGLTVVNPDRGLTIETFDPLPEFDSFFGEHNSIKARPAIEPKLVEEG